MQKNFLKNNKHVSITQSIGSNRVSSLIWILLNTFTYSSKIFSWTIQAGTCRWYFMYRTSRLKLIQEILNSSLRRTIITVENIRKFGTHSFHRSTIFVVDFNYFYAISDYTLLITQVCMVLFWSSWRSFPKQFSA